jgi:hypothetical protein
MQKHPSPQGQGASPPKRETGWYEGIPGHEQWLEYARKRTGSTILSLSMPLRAIITGPEKVKLDIRSNVIERLHIPLSSVFFREYLFLKQKYHIRCRR